MPRRRADAFEDFIDSGILAYYPQKSSNYHNHDKEGRVAPNAANLQTAFEALDFITYKDSGIDSHHTGCGLCQCQGIDKFPRSYPFFFQPLRASISGIIAYPPPKVKVPIRAKVLNNCQ